MEEKEVLEKNPPILQFLGGLWTISTYSTITQQYMFVGKWPEQEDAIKDFYTWVDAHEESLKKLSSKAPKAPSNVVSLPIAAKASTASAKASTASAKASAKASTAKASAKAHSFEVGDILVHRISYSMTLVSFYEVIATSGKATLTVRQVDSEVVQGDGYQGRKNPIPGSFLEGEEAFKVRAKKEQAKIKNKHCPKWDGSPEYFNTLD